MNENLQNQNSNQSQKHDFFAQQNRPKRNYDKEPLILRDYLGWGFALFSILTIFYWAISVGYVFEKIHDYYTALEFGNNYFDADYITQCIRNFVIATIALFCIGYFCIRFTKVRYIHFYNSKVELCDYNHKILNTIFFETHGDMITLNNTYNVIGEQYEKYIEKEEGKFMFGSFLHMITREHFGLVFLSIFVFLSLFLMESSFILNILIIAFITLLTQFIEILIFMGIYKRENKSLKNFWKYARKFIIYIKWHSIDRWKPDASIPMNFFSQENHDDLREYVLTVFHRDIDENFKYTSFQ